MGLKFSFKGSVEGYVSRIHSGITWTRIVISRGQKLTSAVFIALFITFNQLGSTRKPRSDNSRCNLSVFWIKSQCVCIWIVHLHGLEPTFLFRVVRLSCVYLLDQSYLWVHIFVFHLLPHICLYRLFTVVSSRVRLFYFVWSQSCVML